MGGAHSVSGSLHIELDQPCYLPGEVLRGRVLVDYSAELLELARGAQVLLKLMGREHTHFVNQQGLFAEEHQTVLQAGATLSVPDALHHRTHKSLAFAFTLPEDANPSYHGGDGIIEYKILARTIYPGGKTVTLPNGAVISLPKCSKVFRVAARPPAGPPRPLQAVESKPVEVRGLFSCFTGPSLVSIRLVQAGTEAVEAGTKVDFLVEVENGSSDNFSSVRVSLWDECTYTCFGATATQCRMITSGEGHKKIWYTSTYAGAEAIKVSVTVPNTVADVSGYLMNIRHYWEAELIGTDTHKALQGTVKCTAPVTIHSRQQPPAPPLQGREDTDVTLLQLEMNSNESDWRSGYSSMMPGGTSSYNATASGMMRGEYHPACSSPRSVNGASPLKSAQSPSGRGAAQVHPASPSVAGPSSSRGDAGAGAGARASGSGHTRGVGGSSPRSGSAYGSSSRLATVPDCCEAQASSEQQLRQQDQQQQQAQQQVQQQQQVQGCSKGPEGADPSSVLYGARALSEQAQSSTYSPLGSSTDSTSIGTHMQTVLEQLPEQALGAGPVHVAACH